YKIYELWGTGTSYDELHTDVRARTQSIWPGYVNSSFRFYVDCYQAKRSSSAQRELIEAFSFMGLEGPIIMNDPELEFCIFEDYEFRAAVPYQLYLGRFIAQSNREIVGKYNLKKRRYISTTSMDSELALVTANLALSAPGRLFYDPFCGTGSFPIACAHFGAVTVGSDIDGRSIRGTKDRNVVSNFVQYDLVDKWLDGFISDLTNTPLRSARILDGIVCDPPYGVREGLKVLGDKDGKVKEAVYINGELAHLREGFIPPKRAYSFEAMLDDVLDFAANMLADGGTLCMWMPTANDEDIELAIPTHPCLKLTSVCVQAFNKWARRLLTYHRLPDAQVDHSIQWQKRAHTNGLK
ncbi:hypothetical protein LTS18_001653, partial [Coniosporium uncinatum]